MINWNLKILDPSGSEFIDVLDSFQRMFPNLPSHGIHIESAIFGVGWLANPSKKEIQRYGFLPAPNEGYYIDRSYSLIYLSLKKRIDKTQLASLEGLLGNSDLAANVESVDFWGAPKKNCWKQIQIVFCGPQVHIKNLLGGS